MKLRLLNANDYKIPDMRLRPIYKQDTKSGGWMALYKDVAVIGQGKSKKEAFKCLKRDIREISSMGVPLYNTIKKG